MHFLLCSLTTCFLLNKTMMTRMNQKIKKTAIKLCPDSLMWLWRYINHLVTYLCPRSTHSITIHTVCNVHDPDTMIIDLQKAQFAHPHSLLLKPYTHSNAQWPSPVCIIYFYDFGLLHITEWRFTILWLDITMTRAALLIDTAEIAGRTPRFCFHANC